MAEPEDPSVDQPNRLSHEGAGLNDANSSTNPIMSNLRQTISILALLLSMLLTSLDLTILSTAIPRISHDFHSLDDVGWYASAFFLTMAVFQGPWGKLYKYSSVKYTFLVAILTFELGTLGCAVSSNSAGFIAGRAVAGIGGAGVIGGTYNILALIVPPERIPIFYGLNGVIFAVASVSGPLVGGAFTSDVTWRWCFYINLPIGGFVMVLLFFVLQIPTIAKPVKVPFRELLLQLDIPGCILITGGLVCYLLALEVGGLTKSWNSSQSIGLLVGWILLTIAFVVVKWLQGDGGLVSSHHLRSRGVLTCCTFAFFLNAANYIRLYCLPLFFQAIQGTSPERSGVLLLAYIVLTSVFTLIAGALLGKVGYYQPFLVTGAAIVLIGSGLLWTLDIDTSGARVAGYQVLAGSGDGICVQIPVTAVGAFVEPKDLPTATAMVLFFQLLSGVIGVAAGQSIFSNRLVQTLPRYTTGVNSSQILHIGASELNQNFTDDTLQGVREAYLVGIKGAWIMTMVLCSAAIVIGLAAPRISISKGTESKQRNENADLGEKETA
ncbi:efflux pump antibiotic resistance protein, putative [Talaromyces stipitatus ATCC 10500]|uniref:Efflux pump antibiotic resistance protein, putative n=1 Tax=Talaromyces stipitatus (strain ATCC 10500 / CBS 375.48 / QM 6759 / NRRL 1006) TaxID=441959 RepID=B8MSU5_TALSN|nr:efflux pump antibiotic resistance protein, putative [Talaromyces stipitatus ATCC 10500]EED11989.1 efflux pump antibiotic resistance protein, putative [Talaromyces stipitatus ATCC 10500]